MGGRHMVLGALCASVLCAPAGDAAPQAAPGRPLVTGFVLAGVTDWDVELDRARGAGGRVARLPLFWSAIAPDRPPSRAAARDPGFGGDAWSHTDRVVRMLAARRMEPILSVSGAPEWAQARGPRPNGGAFRPSPQHFADFVRAAATRYSGRYQGLPRVRYWQVWNEPNLTHFLNPQTERGRLVSPAWYRALVNAFADSVKSVHRDNVVVAGGLAPFTCQSSAPTVCSTAPLRFMRSLLCLSRALRPVCAKRTRFDVWAHHPYTSGGPTRQAFRRDDASIGDLPEMNAVLRAAFRHRRIASAAPPQFWVTEFSWDSRPPDRGGVPTALHARWVAEALYRMWKSGVRLVTWWTIRDGPYPESPFQSGLYYRGDTLDDDRPKPALRAFRFPFVAFARGKSALVWGRTPNSAPAMVAVQQSVRGRWRRVAVVRAGRHGVFSARVRLRGRGPMRAAVGPGSRSLARPFSLRVPPDMRVNPFGDYGQARR